MTSESTSSAPLSVPELLRHREQVQEWLARLDQQSAVVSERIVGRVRADYEQRLQGILEELRSHADGLQREHGAARDAFEQAERELEDATDQLEEARLRHAIGELDGEEWKGQQTRLEDAVAEAEQRRDESREELDRLDEILAQVNLAPAAPDAGRQSGAAALVEPAGPDDVSATMASDPDDVTVEAPLRPAAAPAGAPDGLAFLEELDRAMADDDAGAEAEAPARARTGVKCAECGYTNDTDAWYCGVCGIDLT